MMTVMGGGGNRQYWVHDKFTTSADVTLDNHVPTEESLGGAKYTKMGSGTGVVSAIAATGRAENVSGNWDGYGFDFGVLVPKHEVIVRANGATGISAGGVVTRLDGTWAGGTLAYIDVGSAGTTKIHLLNWNTSAPLATAVTLAGDYYDENSNVASPLTLVVEDDGTNITAYTLEEPSVAITAAAVGAATNTGGGIYFESSNLVQFDEYKAFI